MGGEMPPPPCHACAFCPFSATRARLPAASRRAARPRYTYHCVAAPLTDQSARRLHAQLRRLFVARGCARGR